MQLDMMVIGGCEDDDGVPLVDSLKREFNSLKEIIKMVPSPTTVELSQAFRVMSESLAGFKGHDWSSHDEFSDFVDVQQGVLGLAMENGVDLREIAGEEIFSLAFER